MSNVAALLALVTAGNHVETREIAISLVTAAGELADTGPQAASNSVEAVRREFERHVGPIRLDGIRGVDGVELLRAAKDAHGWRGAIRVASVLNWTDAWGAAMTAYYGPVGVHESRCDELGRPTPETIAQFPRVAEAMRAAEARFESLLGWYARHGGTTRWEHVIAPKRAA